MAEHNQGSDTQLISRKSLEITVNRACYSCGAPAQYRPEAHIKNNWPGSWRPEDDPLCYTVATETCPNCGVDRNAPEVKGEVWYRELWGKFVSSVKGS